jgi:hypothetical protein
LFEHALVEDLDDGSPWDEAGNTRASGRDNESKMNSAGNDVTPKRYALTSTRNFSKSLSLRFDRRQVRKIPVGRPETNRTTASFCTSLLGSSICKSIDKSWKIKYIKG